MRPGHALASVASLLLVGAIWSLAEQVNAKYRLMRSEAVVDVSPLPITAGSMPLPEEIALVLPPIEDLSAVVERPIFSQSRRPVEMVTEVIPAATPPSALEVDLVGVVISAAERLILVRSKLDNTVIKIGEGGSVAGWVAVGIEPERVLLRNGEQEYVLRLSYKNLGGNG